MTYKTLEICPHLLISSLMPPVSSSILSLSSALLIGLLIVPQTRQACLHPRTFARAVSDAWPVLSDIHMARSLTSFRTSLKSHLSGRLPRSHYLKFQPLFRILLCNLSL